MRTIWIPDVCCDWLQFQISDKLNENFEHVRGKKFHRDRTEIARTRQKMPKKKKICLKRETAPPHTG